MHELDFLTEAVDRDTVEMVAAAERLLLRHGPHAVSVRRVAEEARISPSTLVSRVGTKEMLVARSAEIIAHDRLANLREDTTLRNQGLAARLAGWLPSSRAEDARDRSWLAIREFAVEFDVVARIVARNRERELAHLRLLLRQSMGRPLDVEAEIVHAFLCGLVDDLVRGVLHPEITAVQHLRWPPGEPWLRDGVWTVTTPVTDTDEQAQAREHARAAVARLVDALCGSAG